MTLHNRFLPISLFAILWLRAVEHDIFLPSRWLTLCLFLLEICSRIMHWILYGEVVWHGFLVLPYQRYASVLFFIIFFLYSTLSQLGLPALGWAIIWVGGFCSNFLPSHEFTIRLTLLFDLYRELFSAKKNCQRAMVISNFGWFFPLISFALLYV